MCDHNILPTSCPKLEGNDVWILLLGGDLKDGGQLVSVLQPRPPCPVRELTQYHQTLCCEQQVAGGGRGIDIDSLSDKSLAQSWMVRGYLGNVSCVSLISMQGKE